MYVSSHTYALGVMRALLCIRISHTHTHTHTQETSLAVMGALLIYDISSPDSMANPANKLPNPMALMSCNAFHGGAMRCLYMYTTGTYEISHTRHTHKAYCNAFHGGAMRCLYMYTTGVPYVYALCVCLMCMPYVYALCVCLICMPYMYALYVCLT